MIIWILSYASLQYFIYNFYFDIYFAGEGRDGRGLPDIWEEAEGQNPHDALIIYIILSSYSFLILNYEMN